MRARAYLRTWLFACCAIVLAVATFNLVVDPYGIYHLVDRDGFNGMKSRAGQQGVLFKEHLLERSQSNAIILGNSRSEVGFDPEHPAFSRSGDPALNLAVAGTHLGIAARLLHQAIATHRTHVVVLGLDFVDARISGDPESGRREYQALTAWKSDSRKDWRRRTLEYLQTLAALDAFYDSIATLRDNRQPYPPGLTRLGLNPLRQYAEVVRLEGFHMIFLQRDRENISKLVQGPKEIFVQGTRTSPYFQVVREMVDDARAAGIELHVVIYPYHAHMLEVLHLTKLWQPFESWKVQLAEILRQEAEAQPGRQPFPLWDFTGYNTYTTEPVPPNGDHETQTQWYWDPGHFKKKLGDLILDRVLARTDAPSSPSGPPGANLLTVDLERHLASVDAGRSGYLAIRPDEAAQLAELVQTAIDARKK